MDGCNEFCNFRLRVDYMTEIAVGDYLFPENRDDIMEFADNLLPIVGYCRTVDGFFFVNDVTES